MKDKEKQIEEMTKDLGIAFQLAGTTSFIKVAEILVEKYQPKLPKNSVVLSKEEYEKLKTQLKIKTDEAEWRADQLQALDKDFELLEKVVKCKDCKWLEEKHYEEDSEKPYIKFVCKLTKRQCRLYDFCSYGEVK